jgi:magnesium-transporting ATPase (P-type)
MSQQNQPDKEVYQFYINDPQRNQQQFHFKKNKINTRKYNWITFIPHALLIQFARPANIYFLVSAILNCIPQISPISPVTAILPLIIVLAVSLIREAFEDCQRASLDRQQNNEPTLTYRGQKWTETISGDLDIGGFGLSCSRSDFPC